jgi:uncharacterized protein (TIGR00369 family)
MGFVRSGAEELFGVTMTVGASRTSGSMPPGPWLRGPDGRPSAGALGVLVDDGCGWAVNASAPGGGWSSTTELSFVVLGALPTSGSVHVEGSVTYLDEQGGLGRCELRDDAGRLVGFAHGRNRFVTQSPPPGVLESGRVEHGLALPAPGSVHGVLEVLGPGVLLGEQGLEVRVGPRLGNPRGTLHGGVSLCLCESAAALAAPGLLTTSVVVHFLRPVPDGTTLTVAPVVRHQGRTLAVVEVSGRREDGKECIRATVTRESPSPLTGTGHGRTRADSIQRSNPAATSSANGTARRVVMSTCTSTISIVHESSARRRSRMNDIRCPARAERSRNSVCTENGSPSCISLK